MLSPKQIYVQFEEGLRRHLIEFINDKQPVRIESLYSNDSIKTQAACSLNQSTYDQSKFLLDQTTETNFKCKLNPSSIKTDSDRYLSYSEIMIKRWQEQLSSIPKIDQQDQSRKYPLSKSANTSVQDNPEYSQSCYLAIRKNETDFFKSNQVQLHKKTFLSPKIKKSFNYEDERAIGIQTLYDLNRRANYKIDTLFMAASIFDRYLKATDFQALNNDNVFCLSATCLLIGAKMEEPLQPCFENMIGHLEKEEQKGITLKRLHNQEAQILIALQFDFNVSSPTVFIDRYLIFLGYDFDHKVKNIATSICKFQLIKLDFQNYMPSMIAACALIVAINIYEIQEKDKQGTRFFDNCKKIDKKYELNFEFWNTPEIYNLTKYSIEDIKQCLHDLCSFMIEDLLPNRLEKFYITSIKYAKNFNSQQYKKQIL